MPRELKATKAPKVDVSEMVGLLSQLVQEVRSLKPPEKDKDLQNALVDFSIKTDALGAIIRESIVKEKPVEKKGYRIDDFNVTIEERDEFMRIKRARVKQEVNHG